MKFLEIDENGFSHGRELTNLFKHAFTPDNVILWVRAIVCMLDYQLRGLVLKSLSILLRV